MAYFNPDDAPEEILNANTKRTISVRFRNLEDLKDFGARIGIENIDTRTKQLKYVPKSHRVSLDFLF